MTKTQVKSRIKKLLDQLGDIRAELSDLKDEVEETLESIEPYEGYNDLTEEQEDRKDWLDQIAYSLGDLVDNIESGEWELEEEINQYEIERL